MLLVYVDTGGMLKEVAALEAAGLLKTHYFPFEQRNRRVKAFVPGSGATWKQSNLSWKEAPGTWNDYKPSALFEPLRKLLGAQVDAQHLDSAVKAGCSVFLTSDKTDIWSKRDAIKALANIRVLHMPSELTTLRQLANQGKPAAANGMISTGNEARRLQPRDPKEKSRFPFLQKEMEIGNARDI